MVTRTILFYLEKIKKSANPTYFKDKKELAEKIYSFQNKQECFDKLKCSEAWRLVNREPKLLEDLKPEIKEEIESLADMYQASL